MTSQQERIFLELRDYFCNCIGVSEEFGPDSRIDQILERAGIWDDIDMGDVEYWVEDTFGCNYSHQEWGTFLGLPCQSAEEWERNVGPRFTFRSLAEFISARLEPLSTEPVSILGKRCLTAGMFREIEKLVRSMRPDAGRFSPSTQINSVLERDDRRRLWARLRWLSQGRLPKASTALRNYVMASLSCLSLGLFVLACMLDSAATAAMLVKAGLCIAFLAVLRAWMLSPDIPRDVVTFGDLARRLAAAFKQTDHTSVTDSDETSP